MLKQILLPVLLLFIWQHLWTQSIENIKESLQSKPFEKLYLHTDRDFYFAEDTLWFSAYLLHPQTHQPLNTDCNLYVELLDKNGESTLKELFAINDGFCSGQLSLEDRIPEDGNYLLRASTDLLRSYGQDYCHSKAIRICKLKNTLVTNPGQNEISKIHLDLFPEGGFLLANQYNQMAFKASDQDGSAVDISGKLLDELDSTVMEFKSQYRGMGIIHFVPDPEKKYHFSIDGFPNVSYSFPEIRSTGSKLMLSKQTPAEIEIHILSNNTQSHQKYFLATMHRNEPGIITEIKLTEEDNAFLFKTKQLKHGINRVVLLNDNIEPISERLIFVDKKEDNLIKIKLNKTEFKTREKVSLEIKGTTQEAMHLSVSVIDDCANTEVSQNIKSYLLADSELKGYIPCPYDFFTNSTNISSAQKLNLLMITHGWSNYVWNNLSNNTILPEYKNLYGLQLSGNVKNLFGRKLLKNAEVSLSISQDENTTLDYSRTDSLGKYTFQNIQFYDSATVLVQAYNKHVINNTKLTLNNTSFNSLELADTEREIMTHFSEIPLTLYQRKYENEKILEEFFPDERNRLLEEIEVNAPKIKKENLGYFRPYKEPNYTVKVEEYHYSYPDVLEFLSGRIPGQVKGLLLIDGIEFNDTAFITSIPMMNIDRVEILRHAAGAYYGMSGRDGVINIILKKGNEDAPKAEALYGTIVKRIKGFSKYREFYSPQYTHENINSESPDFRTTFYWNPALKTNNGKTSLSFFTCDNHTRYKIYVEGITETGKICLGVASFDVIQTQNNLIN